MHLLGNAQNAFQTHTRCFGNLVVMRATCQSNFYFLKRSTLTGRAAIVIAKIGRLLQTQLQYTHKYVNGSKSLIFIFSYVSYCRVNDSKLDHRAKRLKPILLGF